MPLLEVLTVQVGPAVANAILKYWLRDPSLFNATATGVGSSLIDVFKRKTSDVFAQRRGEIQFDQIGLKMAEHLHRIIEQDGARIAEGEREAVVLKVAETIKTADIGPKLLISHDLNPAIFREQLLRDVRNVTRDFSADATELYKDIINECSQSIIDIASQLPTFNERTFAEVLKRERQLESIATAILDEVRQLRESSQQSEPQAARFETEYRRAVIRQLDELELFGAEVSRASKRHRLSVAYVTLSVAKQRRILRPQEHLRDDWDDDDNVEIIAADEALNQYPRLLLRGSAGSGKTTLLQWIAVRSAQQAANALPNTWNHRLPFFIRLRQITGSDFPKPEAFPSLIAPAISGTMPDGWVHQQLESGRAIVLVDGVDEVSSKHRHAVHNWLRALVDHYPKTRFVISSRPHAVEEGWMAPMEFGEAELQPMDVSNVRLFIEHWHRAVREVLQDEEEKAELERLVAPLQDYVARSRQLRELTTNPLLCAMLCALNRDRREQLPSDRIELYRACCNMLLEKRDQERRIDLSDYPRLTLRQKEALLQDLAYWLIRNGWSQVKVEDADLRFDRRLCNMPGLAGEVTGYEVRSLLVDRTGLIREPVMGAIDFTHRTFQEFLAAQAALDEVDIGTLADHGDDDQWREVIILAAGLAGMKRRSDLLRELITRGNQDEYRRHTLHLLAVACLETSVDLEPEVLRDLQACLEALVPPKNMTEAKALASAGELAVPYLAPRKGLLAPAAAASIRALALIGSESALNQIVAYVDDRRRTVLSELSKAADAFDQYAIDPIILQGESPLTYFRRVDRHAQWRIIAGNLLNISGDPRFRADAWYLPDEPQLGFIEIPEGEFWMGSDPKHDSNSLSYEHYEQPQHRVFLSTYFIARYPVTVAQFRAFVEASGYDWKSREWRKGEANHPVVYVSWDDAQAYCQWLTEQLRYWAETPKPLATFLRGGGCLTLPSEAQWEKASRGPDGRVYPWGDDADPDRANYETTAIGRTSPVGCFPRGASPYGVEEMSGNVWEWCLNWYKDYDLQSPERDPKGPATGTHRVYRGGSWNVDALYVRATCRLWSVPSYRNRSIGFRCSSSGPSK